MWNKPSKKRLSKIPRLYETEDVPLKDKIIWLHFFIGGSDWYICEYDGDDLFFGFVILNNDDQMAEWGYISFSELKSLKANGWIEVDCELEEFWEPKRAIEVDRIRIAQGWPKENNAHESTPEKEELILKAKTGYFDHIQYREVVNEK
jgi:hypothetical protein